MESVLSDNTRLGFAIASVLFAGAGAVPYMVALIVGHRPAWSSFVAWLIIGATGFVFHLQTIADNEPELSAFLPATFVIIPMAYIALLIKLKAGWDLQLRDKLCLSAAAVCWLVWVTTHQLYGESDTTAAAIPMIVLVLTDGFSSWPILRSAFSGHESGKLNKWSWGLTALSTICGLAAVSNFASSEVIYPLYLLIMMHTIAYASLRSMTAEAVPAE